MKHVMAHWFMHTLYNGRDVSLNLGLNKITIFC